MDLDEQELKATRKLHRLDKYDDTDYLINREESIEYKISDTNDDSIKEDIMSEEAFNELIDNFEIVNTLTEYGRKAIKQNVKNLQKRIKELEEENATLRKAKNIAKEVKIEDITQVMNKSYEEFMKQFVSKQKIKEKFKETQKLYEENLKQVDLKEVEKIDIKIFEGIKLEAEKELLRKLLQESEDK